MDNHSAIPDNWEECIINDVSIKIHYGYTAKANENGRGSKYLRITDIQENKVNWDTVPFCEIDDEEIEKFELKENNIVFARTGGTVGKSFLIKNDVPSKAVFASYLIRIKLSNYIDKKYIYLFFQSLNYWSQIELGKTGLKTNVNAQILSKLKLNLAPLPEQRAIVAKIEQLFCDLDNGMANLKKAQEQLKIYRQAVLKKAFEGEFTGGTKRWACKKMEAVVELIDGDRGPNYPKRNDYLYGGYCLFLSTKNVRPDGFEFNETVYISEEKHNQLRKGTLNRGDIILTTRGTIGNVAYYGESVPFDVIRINSGMLILSRNSVHFT